MCRVKVNIRTSKGVRRYAYGNLRQMRKQGRLGRMHFYCPENAAPNTDLKPSKKGPENARQARDQYFSGLKMVKTQSKT